MGIAPLASSSRDVWQFLIDHAPYGYNAHEWFATAHWAGSAS